MENLVACCHPAGLELDSSMSSKQDEESLINALFSMLSICLFN